MNDEQKELYHLEIEWRSKEIEDLKYALYQHRKELAKLKQPRNYINIFFVSGIFLLFSLIPGWNYSRNLWQTIAYYINKTLWSIKDWWY
jgi:hypothetical protein|tara:strand:+ start:194 stop:460 length:267 start_codon:yes stop_codon:yes gene_type:complete